MDTHSSGFSFLIPSHSLMRFCRTPLWLSHLSGRKEIVSIITSPCGQIMIQWTDSWKRFWREMGEVRTGHILSLYWYIVTIQRTDRTGNKVTAKRKQTEEVSKKHEEGVESILDHVESLTPGTDPGSFAAGSGRVWCYSSSCLFPGCPALVSSGPAPVAVCCREFLPIEISVSHNWSWFCKSSKPSDAAQLRTV